MSTPQLSIIALQRDYDSVKRLIQRGFAANIGGVTADAVIAELVDDHRVCAGRSVRQLSNSVGRAKKWKFVQRTRERANSKIFE